MRRLCLLLGLLAGLTIHYSAPNLSADCPCGAHCPGACCDCGCSDVQDCKPPLPAPSISPADEAGDEITNVGHNPVLLEFSSQHCGPCRQMAATVDQLISDGYKIRKIDTDADPQTTQRYQVTGIPCFVLVDQGREVSRIVGLTDRESLANLFPQKPDADRVHAALVPVKYNFSVYAAQPLAKQIADVASKSRKQLSLDWFGDLLPDWDEPCKIHVEVKNGNGGCTSLFMDQGRYMGAEMKIQGSPEGMLGSVVPHEVFHTVMASHVKKPLPRWIDEGTASCIEAESERQRLYDTLTVALAQGQRIPFRNLIARGGEIFDMQDVPVFYAESEAAVEFLVECRGRRTLGDCMLAASKSGDWPGELQKRYGLTVDQFESQWFSWVNAGKPKANEHVVAYCNNRWNGRLFLRLGQQPAQPAAPQVSGPVSSPAASDLSLLDPKFQALHDRLSSLEQNLATKLDKLPIPLGSQLNDVQQKLAALPAPPNLGPLTSGLTDLHAKADALLANGGALKQKLDAFNATPIGETVKTAVDGAVAPVLAKLGAPIAAELGLPALATVGVAGGVPGLIVAAVLALVLKKKSVADPTGTGGPLTSGLDPTAKIMADIGKMKTAIDGFGKQTAAAPPAPLPMGPDGPIVVQTQTKPPPQQVVRDTQYVNIVRDSPELQGLNMGIDEYVKRNPQMQPAAEAIRGFAKQFTSGLAAAGS